VLNLIDVRRAAGEDAIIRRAGPLVCRFSRAPLDSAIELEGFNTDLLSAPSHVIID